MEWRLCRDAHRIGSSLPKQKYRKKLATSSEEFQIDAQRGTPRIVHYCMHHPVPHVQCTAAHVSCHFGSLQGRPSATPPASSNALPIAPPTIPGITANFALSALLPPVPSTSTHHPIPSSSRTDASHR